MQEVELENGAWNDSAFLAEMDRRAEEYEAGKAKLFTIEEMETNAREYFRTRNTTDH